MSGSVSARRSTWQKFAAFIVRIARGQWQYLLWRAQMKYRGVDLEEIGQRELGLSDSNYGHAMSGGPDFEKTLRQINIPPGSSIIDIGCGKGGAMLTMARLPFSRVAGCDISPELIRTAEKNLASLGIRGLALFCCDATQLTDLDGYSHFFFYNPFSADVFKRVFDNIFHSLLRMPRKLTIIYKNPQSHEVIVAGSIFAKIGELRENKHSIFVYTNQR